MITVSFSTPKWMSRIHLEALMTIKQATMIPQHPGSINNNYENKITYVQELIEKNFVKVLRSIKRYNLQSSTFLVSTESEVSTSKKKTFSKNPTLI